MADLKRYELLPSEHSSCDTLQEYDAGSLCLYSDTESLRAENERLENLVSDLEWSEFSLGCLTGDCPHATMHGCMEALREFHADLNARMKAVKENG